MWCIVDEAEGEMQRAREEDVVEDDRMGRGVWRVSDEGDRVRYFFKGCKSQHRLGVAGAGRVRSGAEVKRGPSRWWHEEFGSRTSRKY